MANLEKTSEETKTSSTYTKEQTCLSERFKDSRDILNALLADGKQYTIDEIKKVISDFKAKPIKEKVNGGGK